MRERVRGARRRLYAELTPGRRRRSHGIRNGRIVVDYVSGLIEDFVELRGDRKFGDDAAILGGLGRFRGAAVCVIGHEKGSRHHQPHQAQLRHGAAGGLSQGGAADGHGRPVQLAGHDASSTPAGAYPGIGAEERGQAEAIARSTERCLTHRRSQ